MLHERQVAIISDFQQTVEGGESGVKQMIMGAGKTTVVSPLLSMPLDQNTSTKVCAILLLSFPFFYCTQLLHAFTVFFFVSFSLYCSFTVLVYFFHELKKPSAFVSHFCSLLPRSQRPIRLLADGNRLVSLVVPSALLEFCRGVLMAVFSSIIQRLGSERGLDVLSLWL